MGKLLCAFSSNFRPLYIGDIYKVLSMPEGYIVHFRYKKKYVDFTILNDPKKYENNSVTIFFTDIDQRKATNYSVRKAYVTKIEVESTTDLVHIYMSLEKFVNTKLLKDINADSLPINKYLIPLEIESENNSNWKDKIENLNHFFKDLSFFHFKNLTKSNGRVIKLSKRKDLKRSYYDLTQGSDYLMNISLGNPLDTKSTISITPSSDDIAINSENPLSITARYDDLVLPVNLKSLNVSRENSFISLGPLSENPEGSNHLNDYKSNLEVQKSIGIFNAIKFGIASLLAILAIWTIKDHSKSIWNINREAPIDIILIIAGLVLLGATSYLFHKFNKK